MTRETLNKEAKAFTKQLGPMGNEFVEFAYIEGALAMAAHLGNIMVKAPNAPQAGSRVINEIDELFK